MNSYLTGRVIFIRKITRENVRLDLSTIFAVGFAFLLGLYVRLSPAIDAGFPINDGGLFYTMVNDLLDSGFNIPSYTSYNGSRIPFVYPPLPFYLAAAITRLGNIELLDVLRFFPALMSALTVPGFYLLARSALRSKPQAVLATFVFSMLPRSFEWLVMGGGLTRATGYLFAILTIYMGFRFFREPLPLNSIFLSIFVSLTILSHPEMSFFIAYTLVLQYLFLSRRKQGLQNSALVILLVILMISPWIASVLLAHGPGPLWEALRSGHKIWLTPGKLLMLDLTSEPFLSLIGVIALFGILACVIERQFFLPVWVAIISLASPRSSETLLTIPFAMLAAIGIDRIIVPGVRQLTGSNSVPYESLDDRDWADNWLQPGPVRFLIGFLIFYCLVSARVYPILGTTAMDSLPSGEREAMEWVSTHTPDTSRFVVLSGLENVWQDQSAEWFPALAERQSVSTVQGFEWVPTSFYARWINNSALQSCANQEDDCLESWSRDTGQDFSHIYLSKREIPEFSWSVTPLLNSLKRSMNYDLLYENSEAAIFARRTE